jgi:hypothetical protein
VDLDQGEVPLVFEMPFSHYSLIFSSLLQQLLEEKVREVVRKESMPL